MIRFLDILFSSLAIVTLLPLLLPIMLILKFSGEGEVFFLQERIGKSKKIFKLFKFVTMVKNSDSIGTGTVTIKDDPRVLPVGRLLRKTKIKQVMVGQRQMMFLSKTRTALCLSWRKNSTTPLR